ncbi:hypothetical protein [Thermoactinospora rubra]|uniref:hypothetical protein n=1 Tax=Thermoactinospora rubra TaxID=1088767 RepID=UPI000A113345|nr:hypothetical protein [Thermoactinospora rubra]
MLDVLDVPLPDELGLICGLAALIWTALVLRAQWRDDRWQRATVGYGIASVVVPLPLALVTPLLASMGDVYGHAVAANNALMMIWLARSAHDLADPHRQPAPPSPLVAEPQG